MLIFTSEEALIKWVQKQKLPEWKQKLYRKHSEAIQVHSQGQLFYKLDTIFPNEHPASKAHRILSFESITEASFGRAANNVNRIFKNSSYTVDASEKTLEILDADNFERQNFYSWFLDEWVKWSLKEDPNAKIAFYPPEYVKDGKPPVVFIPSDHIRYEDEDSIVFVSEEESEVDYNLREVCIREEVFLDPSINRPNIRQAKDNTYAPKWETTIKRPVYHVFDKGKGFYRIEQVRGKATEFEFQFFPIEQDFLPVTDVGGDKGKKGINKSFLHPFVAFGNLALLQHSQHTAVNFIFSFPKMSELESPCEAPGCIQGFVDVEESDQYPEGRKPCLKCRGTGYTANQSPYKIYKKRLDPNGMDGDNKHLEVDDVRYYTPPTAILDYSKKEWKDYLEQAETNVYISQRVKTGNVESAESKRIDRDDLFSFLTRVGKVFFSKMKFAVQAFENYYVSNPQQVNVNEPYSYAILSEGEAFEALKTILESTIPVMIKGNQVESFINKFVSQGSPLRRFLDVLKLVDLLLYYNANELASFKVAGVIKDEALSIHVYAFPVLQRMYFENKAMFQQQETKAIAEKLKKELEAYKPEPVEDLKTKLLKEQNQKGE